jgi:hypothetical protein
VKFLQLHAFFEVDSSELRKAAAHQADAPRADADAIQTVVAAVGNECRKKQDKTVVEAAISVIDEFKKTGRFKTEALHRI